MSAVAAASLAAATYHVDCAPGRDARDGLSPSTAFNTLDEVNRRTFAPGDSILFRRDSSCTGMLWPKGSGTAGEPIRLGAYGTGALPRIEAQGKHQAALKLFNQEYWEIASLDVSGGTEFGIYITGDVKESVLHHIHVRDVVVHDVMGVEPKPDLKAKESGLIVITPGAAEQRFDDVLVDGATAYNTNQWSGIMVGGAAYGIPHDRYRSTNIVVRNSTVHDVYGDGIIVFFAHRAMIERSVAWNTGFQPNYSIGTPNAIWTWMCRECTVQFNEAYLSDSPGFDGGAFDIDWADDDNIVQYNYGHDTQGYCIAVFGAGYTSRNSIVRYNVCANNGLSPRLARLQGAVFVHTWDGGKLDGVVSPEYHGIGLGKHAFRLAPGSPAIDAAAAWSNMGAHDVFGVAIPQGKGYDIGASEFPVADRSASLLWPNIERFKGKWLLVGLVGSVAQAL